MHFPSRWNFLDILQLSRIVSPICIWSLQSSSGLGHTAGMGCHLTNSLVLHPPHHSASRVHSRLLTCLKTSTLDGFPLSLQNPGEGRHRKGRSQCFFGLWWTTSRSTPQTAEVGLKKWRDGRYWGSSSFFTLAQ